MKATDELACYANVGPRALGIGASQPLDFDPMSDDEDARAQPAAPPASGEGDQQMQDDILALLGADLPDVGLDAANDIENADLPPLDSLDPLDPVQLGTEPLLDLDPEPMTEASKEETERERMQLLVSHFDEQQMARYAAFRRANIRRAAIRKFASGLLNQPISNSVAVVLAGMSKVLIGDVVELARDLQEKDKASRRDEGGAPDAGNSAEPEPLLPAYVREAWRIYKRDTGTVPEPRTRPGSANRFF